LINLFVHILDFDLIIFFGAYKASIIFHRPLI